MNNSFFSTTLLLSLLTLLVACNKPTAQEETPIPVITQQAKESTFENSINISGNVMGQQTVQLAFMVPGQVNQVTLEEGQSIQKGKLLASLDPTSYQLARNIAKAKYDEIEDEYNRLSAMHTSGSLSESDFVKISSGLEQAKANYLLQEKNLKDTRLHAPISGVLLKRGAEPGEIIGQGTRIFGLSDIDTVQVNASVPEGELNSIHLGDTCVVEIPSLGQSWKGSITQIGAAAEPTTRTFNIKIDLPNSDLKLRPGMVAEVKIPEATTSSKIAIPASAILTNMDNTHYVYVADKEKKKAYKRKVTIGAIQQNNISILSGLNPNEWIVTGGQENLQDGSSINISK